MWSRSFLPCFRCCYNIGGTGLLISSPEREISNEFERTGSPVLGDELHRARGPVARSSVARPLPKPPYLDGARNVECRQNDCALPHSLAQRTERVFLYVLGPCRS